MNRIEHDLFYRTGSLSSPCAALKHVNARIGRRRTRLSLRRLLPRLSFGQGGAWR